MEFWQAVGIAAALSVLTGVVVAVWSRYLPDGPGPFDADEGDVR